LIEPRSAKVRLFVSLLFLYTSRRRVKNEFSVILLNHTKFGWIVGAYTTVADMHADYRHVLERVTPQTERFAELTDFEKEIVHLADAMTDEKVFERYGKKKNSYTEFYKKLEPELLNLQILPLISRKVHQILQLCLKHSVALYKSDYRPKKVFLHDRLNYSPTPTETLFNFIKNEEELLYFLSIRQNQGEFKLHKSNASIILNYPCYLLLNNHLFFFTEIDGKKLQPFLEKNHLVIPSSAKKKYLETFVLNAISRYEVRTIGFDVYDRYVQPEIQLIIEAGLQFETVFRLEYKYSSQTLIKASKEQEFVVDFQWNHGDFSFEKIYRDKKTEELAAQVLKKCGLTYHKDGYHYLLHNQSLNASIRWFKENEKELMAKDIQLKQQFGSIRFQLEECKMSFELIANKQKMDWFDLKGFIQFGSYTFPLSAIRPYILKKEREFPLPDGTFGFIPEEWFIDLEPIFLFSTGRENLQIKKIYFNLFRQASAQKSNQILSRAEMLDSLFEIPGADLPDGLKASLRPYQRSGYEWMIYLKQNGFGGCLADDMGLGKTLQTLCLLLQDAENAPKRHYQPQPTPEIQLSLFESPPSTSALSDSKTRTSLIVVPTSLIHNWYRESKKFTPALSMMLYVGSKRSKASQFNRQLSQHQLVITSYGTLRNDIDLLKKQEWNYVVLDESQTIKNPESRIYQAVMELKASHRLVLTGTPIENSLKDLWAQMNFLNPGLLGNLEFFKKQYVFPIEQSGNEKQAEKLRTLTRPFILRRTKEEVASDLPDLTQLVRLCEMTEEQKEIYLRYKQTLRNNLLNQIENQGLGRSSMLILRGIQQLRQLANHPYMIEPDYESTSGKLELVMEMLESLQQEKHKVLIFSNFVKHLNILRAEFEKREWTYSYLSGASVKREKIIEEFQTEADRLFFLISMKAGGVGLNLTQADYIMILDPWWNPAVEMQAVSRAHRIGQEKKVFVYRFITENSIEEKIQILQEKKRFLADQFINSNNPIQGFNLEEIKDLFS
jgi:superfamily II DNA or RNA helicase